MRHTHRLAVTAWVWQQGRFLLLKRNNPPLVWGPPGGRLQRDEDPLQGLYREMAEETALEIRVHGLIDSWFGELEHTGALLSLSYLVTPLAGELCLSSEHSAAAWASCKELAGNRRELLQGRQGFQLQNFQQAEKYAHLLGL